MSSFLRQYLIIGGTGQIGHRLIELILKSNEPTLIVSTSREVKEGLPAGPLAPTIIEKARSWSLNKKHKLNWISFDFDSDENIIQKKFREFENVLQKGIPTVLIISAAFTNVDGCESDPQYCKKVNEINPTALMDWAMKKYDAKPVFYSTDYVFDGLEGPYPETAKRSALSVYGSAKAAVEEWMENRADKGLILRTTGVFDYIPGSKNFAMQMIDLWRQKKTTKIPLDQYANPVWAYEVAKATIDLLSKNASGIFGVAGETYLARTEFAQMIAEVFEFDKSLIEQVKTSALNQKANRPLKGGVKCDKLKTTIGWAPTGARAALSLLKMNKGVV